MMPCVRPPAPEFLEHNWRQWGEDYAKRLEENPGYRFAWKKFEGVRVNHRLLPVLSDMTNDHCAYCDWFPMDVGTDPTIDHFKPKSLFPREAYHWGNLYLSCRACQEKDDRNFDERVLRPDEPGYSFERYFIYNFSNGEVEANPAASAEDQERAGVTIKLLKLNSRGRPAARQREIERFFAIEVDRKTEFIDDSPFRYLLYDLL